ncbi:MULTISPECIES: carbohydrate ABC transporter permease [Lacrimispora]|uniref:Multiple sugar transport system permease protein n=1 Tax=Lacrimispora sphenoides JCM 1415 TaxID=1297793 RepID=A0ABY1CAJ0_9FIRM|nr:MULTISPECIES: carbohydrate ABC transporter permease [Lacrimispora]MDR7811325.1 carbohydrate ABC transporter permease [Lacrimispora sp.]SET86192.1 multiple sugar transport system permease protein [[Clostridium] sphenoides JCM 1415]SUY51862.1 binding-protein-dependent transport system inner membrane protein [Lacrimispora sphenoides]
MNKKRSSLILKVIIYVVCIFLAILSIAPFYIMVINATRSTVQIQQHAISLLPSTYMMKNIAILLGKSFNPANGFLNSLIISTGATLCAVYFSNMTAYGLVVYNWRFRKPFFSFIMAIMMVPAQITMIGFYQMVYRIHMTNNFLMLILPAIASPAMVFFMRQYMLPSLSLEIIQAARIDGAGEFYIFNRIAMPIMKPAIATQAIFCFVSSWNNLFTPLVLLTDQKKYTMPIMVSLLRGDIYKTEYGSVYMGLALTVLPLIVVYLLLSRYIISGVALGGVKG